jgi:hypothetical protein
MNLLKLLQSKNGLNRAAITALIAVIGTAGITLTVSDKTVGEAERNQHKLTAQVLARATTQMVDHLASTAIGTPQSVAAGISHADLTARPAVQLNGGSFRILDATNKGGTPAAPMYISMRTFLTADADTPFISGGKDPSQAAENQNGQHPAYHPDMSGVAFWLTCGGTPCANQDSPEIIDGISVQVNLIGTESANTFFDDPESLAASYTAALYTGSVSNNTIAYSDNIYYLKMFDAADTETDILENNLEFGTLGGLFATDANAATVSLSNITVDGVAISSDDVLTTKSTAFFDFEGTSTDVDAAKNIVSPVDLGNLRTAASGRPEMSSVLQ